MEKIYCFFFSFEKINKNKKKTKKSDMNIGDSVEDYQENKKRKEAERQTLFFQNQVKKLLKKNPNRVPIFVQESRFFTGTLQKKKFLCPQDLTVGQFQGKVRDYTIGLTSSDAVFLMFGPKGEPMCNATRLQQVYAQHKGADLILRCTIMGENTFG